MRVRDEGRVLFFGITRSGTVLGYAASGDDAVTRELVSRDWPMVGVFLELPLTLQNATSPRDQLLAELRRISGCRWIASQKLAADGTKAPYAARNGGGYTLDLAFPHGLFAFTATCPDEGSAVTVQITYPQLLAADAHYWKYGRSHELNPVLVPAAGCCPRWRHRDLRQSGGRLGDDDLSPNRLIVDDGGSWRLRLWLQRSGGRRHCHTSRELALLIFHFFL